jgi:tRNA(fMet)-specific endonuclease VapC
VLSSIVVAAELRSGAAKRDSAKLAVQLEAVLGVPEVVPFEAPADETYALIRTDLENRGTPIGGNDMLTAAHARALEATLVTDNERAFARVDGLPVENWLR